MAVTVEDQVERIDKMSEENTQIPTETSDNSPARGPDGKLLPGGPSLNPGGRPKGPSITAAIKRMLEEKYPTTPCTCSCHHLSPIESKGVMPDEEEDDDEPDAIVEPKKECVKCEQFHQAQADHAGKRTFLEAITTTIFENAIVRKHSKSLDKIWAYIDGLPKGSFDVGVDREGLAELTEFMKAMANPKKQ